VDTTHDRGTEFAELLRRHQTQLFGYIYSLVRDLDDADDLFQQTSLVLWDKFDHYDPGKSFIAWGCGVARFEVSNFLRARSRHRLYFSDELGVMLADTHAGFDPEEVEGRRDALTRCMKKLRERDLELVEACYGRTARIPEVARAWGRSAQSIHNSLRRIRQSLFECVNRSLAREGVV
jgi:RNA polymerase sigma-70 factor (ECF subfamily)